MLAAVRHWIIAYRFRRFTRPIDRQIAQARRAHRPVKHLQAAKTSLVHDALRQAVGR